MTFNTMPLHAAILDNIQKAGYTAPTPIQAQAIPPLVEGRDVMACAQTGTGKTAAFVLPILNRLQQGESDKPGRGPRALILTPTRELAVQILENIDIFARGMRLRTGMVIGGTSYGPQYRMLQQKLDILVATPGRLIDHMNEGKVDFKRIEVVVLDEADRMLDMGFLKPVEKIMARVPNVRQTLLFSATFSKEIKDVAKRMLDNPVKVELAPVTSRHENITQYAMRAADKTNKQELLEQILTDDKMWQAIVFIKTKHGADRLAKKLARDGFKSAALHGDMRQGARQRVMGQMHDGDVQVLVATDVAARGLDVKGLSHVINFDLPQVAEDYVHRIGRTGRAGETGVAISLVGPDDKPLLRGVEKLLGQRIEYRGKGAEAENASHARAVKPVKPYGAHKRTAKKPVGGKHRGRKGKPRPSAA